MAKPTHLKFNSPAPDLELSAATGETVRLASLWASRPLLLAFIRHFGCPQCKELLDFLTENTARLEAAGLSVAIVTQGTVPETLEFCRRHAPGLRLGYADYLLGMHNVLRAHGLAIRVSRTFWRPGRS